MNIFLTGGSSGIGAEYRQHLESLGHNVTAPPRQELDLNNFNINELDLKDFDMLVLCAGVDVNGRQPYTKLKTSDITTTLQVNLIANMTIIHKYVQQRFFKPWSRVVVIGSTITEHVFPNFVAYGTSKVALDTFISSIRTELRELQGNNKIGFTVIHPGLVKTNFHFNRGNVSEEDKHTVYDQNWHMTTPQLLPALDLILNDREHLVKQLSISV